MITTSLRSNRPLCWQAGRFVNEAVSQLRQRRRRIGHIWIHGGEGRSAWALPAIMLPRVDGLDGLERTRAGIRYLVSEQRADGLLWAPTDVEVPTLDPRHVYLQMERFGAVPRVYVLELLPEGGLGPWIELNGDVGETLLRSSAQDLSRQRT